MSEARSSERRASGGGPPWLRRVVAILHDSGMAPRLGELAAEGGVHPAHLTRTFRRFYGSTPGEYARNVRLCRAIVLVRTSRQPIGRIAIEAGFFDQSHFTRWVKRKTGMTPRELRQSQ